MKVYLSQKAWRKTRRDVKEEVIHCTYLCWCPITDRSKDEESFRETDKSGITWTSKPGEGIEFLNTSWILQDCKVTLSDLQEKLLKSATPPPPAPPTYSSRADGQSINYLNAHRDVRSSGQHFNEKQRVDWLLTGPLCFWLPLPQLRVTFIGLDLIKVTSIFSFLLLHALLCFTRCPHGSSIFICASPDSDKVLLNLNRCVPKPKCHLSLLLLTHPALMLLSWALC